MGDFERAFLEQYMAVGFGGLSKKDTEVLIMHLLDEHGGGPFPALRPKSNQDLSVLLKAPVNKIRQLRYEAGLKYAGDVEQLAKAKLLAALSQAVLEPADKKVCLIIEDTLARSWLQGKLKANSLIFDHSFNTEIVKVDANGLFAVLGRVFDEESTAAFRQDYELMLASDKQDQWRATFKRLAANFARGAATVAGGAVVAEMKTLLGEP